MGTGRKIGKILLGVTRGAKKMGEGFDMVLGQDRTRAGDGFSKERAGARAANFTKKARETDKTSGMMDKGKDMDFLDSGKSGKDQDKNKYF